MLPYKLPKILRHLVCGYLLLTFVTAGPAHVAQQLEVGFFRGIDAAFTIVSMGIAAVAIGTGPHDWTKLTAYDYAAGAFTLASVPWLLGHLTGL
jgi:hypothetical protein